MYSIDWNIQFSNNKGTFDLQLLDAVAITSSVESLVDTATITLPDAVMNETLQIEDKIGRGTKVIIKLGYDDDLKTEFEGYVLDIETNDNTINIQCEDALFLFRKKVKDQELKSTSIKKIAETIISQIDPKIQLKVVGYGTEVFYEKFTIYQATGYDVLKKVQEETKANIYFKDGALHIHPPYEEKFGEVVYSYQHNVESSSLQYKKAIDRKLEVTVESVGSDGKVKSYTTGTTGGEKITIKRGNIAASELKKIADAELLKRNTDGFEGSLETWLIPIVTSGYTAVIEDEDYPNKTGRYYVKTVKTNVSSSGGKRSVELGIKLGNG